MISWYILIKSVARNYKMIFGHEARPIILSLFLQGVSGYGAFLLPNAMEIQKMGLVQILSYYMIVTNVSH